MPSRATSEPDRTLARGAGLRGSTAQGGTLLVPSVMAGASVSWAARRLFPLLATSGLIVIGMMVSLLGPRLVGQVGWSLPHDLWGTLIAAQRLVRLELGGLYTQPTGLVTFPGAAVILAPAVLLSDAAGLSLHIPGPHNPQPLVWLLAGPYMIAISAVALFGVDALAEQLQVSRPKRAVLAVASAAALWNVSVQWGHPEDAVAVGLLLFAILALPEGRPLRSAWLTGAAIAVQPLVLLALPIMLAVIQPRRLAGFLVRTAIPATALLGVAAAANWSATAHAVTSQPNWPAVDHPTPWTSLAPRIAGGAVAAGPGRLLAILVACGCGLIVARRLRAARQTGQWRTAALRELLWWVALSLALRLVFESVMVAYYLWPALAVTLIAATRSWWRLIPTSLLAVTVTVASQSDWRSVWGWWMLMVAGVALTLYAAGVLGKDPHRGSASRSSLIPGAALHSPPRTVVSDWDGDTIDADIRSRPEVIARHRADTDGLRSSCSPHGSEVPDARRITRT